MIRAQTKKPIVKARDAIIIIRFGIFELRVMRSPMSITTATQRSISPNQTSEPRIS